LFLIAQIEKRRELWIGHRNDVAAMAAVAAVGPPAGHIFLAPKAYTPAPAIPAKDANLGFIDKLHGNENARSAVPLRFVFAFFLLPFFHHLLTQGKKKAPKGAFHRECSLY
jgi:hypothetical protein